MTTHHPSSATPRAPSLSQRVVDGLSERISSGALKPGDRVPTEPVLMQEFGVSRSVVREAISRLQAGGLLRTQQGVGSFVLSPKVDMPPLQPAPGAVLKLQQKLAMLELRLSLEPEAAALAAQRRTPELLAAMEQALDDFDTQHSTGEATAEADFRFHELLAQATGNEYFSHVLRSLSSATIPRQAAARRSNSSSAKAARFGEPSPELRPGKEFTAQEHWAVLEAIRRGDAAGARAAMFMHLNNSRERMKNASR
ncbi:FadR/GntR family transcriptional regulator [Roseateles sp. LYH14W]|uniref:FadR/GntR family transcriptional regulator n=1 Tax=Pelomonas parva TaxID=3299032 RepID=A0ABW7FCS8_9BURK